MGEIFEILQGSTSFFFYNLWKAPLIVRGNMRNNDKNSLRSKKLDEFREFFKKDLMIIKNYDYSIDLWKLLGIS